MNQSKTLLIVGGIGVTLLLGLVWWNSNKSQPAGPQNAVNPNAQQGAGANAQGTMPDLGNLLSYNQLPGSTILTPQATSVDPFSGNYGQYGGGDSAVMGGLFSGYSGGPNLPGGG